MGNNQTSLHENLWRKTRTSYKLHHRAWHWLGLLVFALPYLVYYSWPYRNHPLQSALFTFPVLLVLFAGLLDGLRQRRNHFETTNQET